MVRGESADSGGDTRFYQELAESLAGIKKAAKDMLFYPSHHPARGQALERTHGQLLELLHRHHPLTLNISREGFSLAKTPIGRDQPLLKAFASDLFLRKIQTLRLLPGLRLEDLQRLTELLNMDPSDLGTHGGGKAFLRGREVSTVEVEELELKFSERMPSLPSAAPDQGGSPGEEGGLLGSAQGEPEQVSTLDQGGGPWGVEAGPPVSAPGERGQAARDMRRPLKAVTGGVTEGGGVALPFLKEEAPADLETLLDELQRTNRAARYEYLVGELSERARTAVAQRDLGPYLRILTTFTLELHPMNSKGEALVSHVRAALTTFVEGAGLELLIEAFCRGGEVREDDLVHLLLSMKEKVAGRLVEQLLLEEETAARRKLTELLVLMGGATLPTIRVALEEASWETARRLLPLLHRLTGPEVGEIWRGLLQHPDPRVRRETIRMVGQVNPEMAEGLILKALEDDQTSVRQAAIAQLGGLKVKKAVPRLQRIAEERPGSRDLEEQKAAIAALGVIGAPEAVPTLIALLHRKSWFYRKVTDELRIAAAYALGSIGVPEAVEALRAVMKSAPPSLRHACEVALRRIPGGSPKEVSL